MVLGTVVGALLVAFLAAIELGHVSLRLPFPPGVEYDFPVRRPPPGSLPLTWNASYVVPSSGLAGVARLLAGRIRGVETVAVAPDGRLGLVDKWGKVFIASPDGAGGYSLPPEPVAWSSPGRTLGVRFDAAGSSLLLCNAPLGLLRLEHPGEQRQRLLLLSGRVSDESPIKPGFPVEFINALDIASDGTIYFSHSTDVTPYKTEDGSWDALDSVFVTIGKGLPTGLLLAYHPANGSTTALLEGLWFANGVALSHDEAFVLVGDSIASTIHRYWLRGPKAGSRDVFAASLPGPVDGISRSQDGATYWVTIYSRPPGIVAYASSRLVRLAIAWAPRILRLLRIPLPKMGLVLRLDGSGAIVQALGDPTGQHVAGVTSAVEAGGRLFLGSIAGDGVPVVDVPPLA